MEVKGTSPRREWTQVIMWLGSEDELLWWEFDYFVVRDPRINRLLASEMTKREAWEFVKAHADMAHLVVENWSGGGNVEASDDQCNRVWAGPLAIPEEL